MKLFNAIAAAAVIGASLFISAPALACTPNLYIDDFEDMLVGGAPWDVTYKALRNSTGYKGNACFYQYKGYAKRNSSKYPNFARMVDHPSFQPRD
jgi:hypothetical protein